MSPSFILSCNSSTYRQGQLITCSATNPGGQSYSPESGAFVVITASPASDIASVSPAVSGSSGQGVCYWEGSQTNDSPTPAQCSYNSAGQNVGGVTFTISQSATGIIQFSALDYVNGTPQSPGQINFGACVPGIESSRGNTCQILVSPVTLVTTTDTVTAATTEISTSVSTVSVNDPTTTVSITGPTTTVTKVGNASTDTVTKSETITSTVYCSSTSSTQTGSDPSCGNSTTVTVTTSVANSTATETLTVGVNTTTVTSTLCCTNQTITQNVTTTVTGQTSSEPTTGGESTLVVIIVQSSSQTGSTSSATTSVPKAPPPTTKPSWLAALPALILSSLLDLRLLYPWIVIAVVVATILLAVAMIRQRQSRNKYYEDEF